MKAAIITTSLCFSIICASAQPELMGFKPVVHVIDGDTLIIEEPVFSDASHIKFIEQMPEAGYDVNEFISKNIVYPKYAQEHGIEGRVNVQFVVTEDGGIDSAKVIKSLDTSLNREALRIINCLPQPWKPAKSFGKIVRSYFTLPIIFRLE